MRRKTHYVTDVAFNRTIQNLINDEKSDYYRDIHKRIIDMQDLGAKNDMNCYMSLRNTLKVIQTDKIIHSQTLQVHRVMEQNYKYIEEDDDCQFSIIEWNSILTTHNITDMKTIQLRLMKYYDDNIVFLSKFQSNTINMVKKVITKYFSRTGIIRGSKMMRLLVKFYDNVSGQI